MTSPKNHGSDIVATLLENAYQSSAGAVFTQLSSLLEFSAVSRAAGLVGT